MRTCEIDAENDRQWSRLRRHFHTAFQLTTSPRHLKVLQLLNGTGEGMSSLHSHSGPEDVSIKLTACRYCAHLNEDYVEYLLLEDKAIYMNFLNWMSRTSHEKRLQTYDEYWRRLCQYFGLFARQPVNHHVHEQMWQVCLSFLFHSYTWILNRQQYLVSRARNRR